MRVLVVFCCLLVCGCDGEPDGQRVKVVNHTTVEITVTYDRVYSEESGGETHSRVEHDAVVTLQPGQSVDLSVHMLFYNWDLQVESDLGTVEYDGNFEFGSDTVDVFASDFTATKLLSNGQIANG